MRTSGAEVQQVDVKVICVPTGDIDAAVVSDLIHADRSLCLEDVKYQRTYTCPL